MTECKKYCVVLKTTDWANKPSVIYGPFETASEIIDRVMNEGYELVDGDDSWKEYDFDGEPWRVAVAVQRHRRGEFGVWMAE